jgi:hypothetical protein
MKVLSWNTGAWTLELPGPALREKAWDALLDPAVKPDVALLQEATVPPDRLGLASEIGGSAPGCIGSLIWVTGWRGSGIAATSQPRASPEAV